MNKKFSKTIVIGLVVILVLSLGAAAAFAQEDAAPDTDSLPALPCYGRGGFSGPRGHHGGAGEEALAEALGITVEELQAAREQMMADRLAQAVEDGTLTQEQADNMLAMHALQATIDRGAILAEALGMTVEEVAAAREDGTLYDILANITPADLQERMMAAYETAVQQAASDGVITQAQADLVLEQLADGAGMMGKFGPNAQFGHGRGGFGERGGFNGVPGAAQDGEAIMPFAFGA